MITLPSGLLTSENKLVFKHQMTVSSSFLLNNGDKTGTLYLSVITEMTGMKNLSKVHQELSKEMDKAVLGLVLITQRTKMLSLNAVKLKRDSSQMVAQETRYLKAMVSLYMICKLTKYLLNQALLCVTETLWP